jgi:hypothetical protein
MNKDKRIVLSKTKGSEAKQEGLKQNKRVGGWRQERKGDPARGKKANSRTKESGDQSLTITQGHNEGRS